MVVAMVVRKDCANGEKVDGIGVCSMVGLSFRFCQQVDKRSTVD